MPQYLPPQQLHTPHPGRQNSGERGYVLLLVIFLVALVAMSFAIAAPKWKSQIQRDQEVELKHRGMQYARGIKLYYKKFGSYPTSLQQLMTGNQMTGSIGFSSGSGSQPGQQRFIRRLYTDPITGKPAWRLVFYGQIGMFSGTCGGTDASTALTGSLATQTQQTNAQDTPAAAAGGSAATTGNCTQPGSADSSASSPSSMFSNSGSGGSGFGSSFGGSSSGGGLGSGSSFGSSGGLGSGSTGSSGTGSGFGSSFGTPGTDPNTAAVGSTTSTPAFGATPGGSGQPIVGVASLSPKKSIMEIKGKSHYNELEFVYDPTQDFGGAGAMSGTSAGGSTGTSPFGGQNSLGSGFGSPSPGGSGGFGSSPSSGLGSSPSTGSGSTDNGNGSNSNGSNNGSSNSGNNGTQQNQ